MEKKTWPVSLESKISLILIRSSLYINDRPQTTPQSTKYQEGSPNTRIQRWALTIAMYEYTLVFKNTNQHSNADALNRLSS